MIHHFEQGNTSVIAADEALAAGCVERVSPAGEWPIVGTLLLALNFVRDIGHKGIEVARVHVHHCLVRTHRVSYQNGPNRFIQIHVNVCEG